MKEVDLTKLIKSVNNINDITSLNGYNSTEFEIIKAFVNKIKEFYKPEKGKVEWMNELNKECRSLAEYFREDKYKDYLDNINEVKKLTPLRMEEFAGLFLYYIYIPGHIVMELLFRRDDYQKNKDDYIFLYRYDHKTCPDGIPILRGKDMTENNYCYIINI